MVIISHQAPSVDGIKICRLLSDATSTGVQLDRPCTVDHIDDDVLIPAAFKPWPILLPTYSPAIQP